MRERAQRGSKTPGPEPEDQAQPSGTDHRRSPRMTLGTRAWCEGERVTLYLQIVNASLGGLFLRTATPLPAGARARVIFKVGEEREIVAEAEVVWTRDGQSALPGMGLRLVQIEAGADAYESFLEHIKKPSA